MSTSFDRICPALPGHPIPPYALSSVESTRELELQYSQTQQINTLIERAGLALAQFTLAQVPHAHDIWIACGPGSNAADGYEAAAHLLQWGKSIHITEDHTVDLTPTAYLMRERAREAGATFSNRPPQHYDVVLDAIFGIGLNKPITGIYAQWVHHVNHRASEQIVIAVDIPSGLDADHGVCDGPCVKADLTLSLLTLKPGLFTGAGRDACGDIWFHSLGIALPPSAPRVAILNARHPHNNRPHNSHKGCWGDVAIIGGASGMAGAATLAATSALHAGAGRIYRVLLNPACDNNTAPLDASIMTCSVQDIPLEAVTLVAGCGGGMQIEAVLPSVITRAHNLVLDADGLNAIANTPSIGRLLASRPPQSTIITPHPLEAARLLACAVADIQANRLDSAKEISQRLGCTVILKGSGSIISAPAHTPCINVTGNSRLATAGTGDVLAGMVGAYWATGMPAFEAACHATYVHGYLADTWPAHTTLTASRLAQAVSSEWA